MDRQDQKHKKHLDLVVSNNRFLILPWVRVKNLASKSLSMACRRLADDWHHGACLPAGSDRQAQHFDASCYRAAMALHTRRRGKCPKPIDEVREVLLRGPRPVSKRSVRAAPKILPAADPFVQLWQNLIGIVTQVAEDFDQWQQRQRVLNSLLIMLIFRLVFSANRQGYAITLAQCGNDGHRAAAEAPVAPSAMCKARAKLDENIFKTLQAQVHRSAGELERTPDSCRGRVENQFAAGAAQSRLPLSLGQRLLSAGDGELSVPVENPASGGL